MSPFAPLKKDDLEQRIEIKLNDVNSFSNSTNDIKEMTKNFKDKNKRSKQNYKKQKRITLSLKSFDTFIIHATTSSSDTLSLTGLGLRVIPISNGIACGLAISNKIMY